MEMKDIFDNKFKDQVSLTYDYLVPEISRYLQINENEIEERAKKIIKFAKNYNSYNAFEKLMHEYDLSSSEGIVLMCLAEALLRIPDNNTINDLIEDKIPTGQWREHIKNENNIFVNISSIAFLMTGKILKQGELKEADIFMSVLKNVSKPVLRSVIKQAINILAKQFIFEKDIKRASKLSDKLKDSIYAYSFDMLGEGARTYNDADKYFENYKNAIKVIGDSSSQKKHSISIKLSALHPRYERNKIDLLRKELLPRLFELINLAKTVKVDVCFDAEEADRLNLSLFIVEDILNSNLIDSTYSGFGIAVQAYQQRAIYVLKWLDKKLSSLNKRMNVRLVKGAYWDTEIKLAQEKGLDNYPVFTKKFITDLSYLKCAHILEASNNIFPQFATHNAFTIAYVQQLFKNKPHEFQKLHGMGDEIYNHFSNTDNFSCRVYAPVGGYNDLLPYLVRRLLENGANTSFIHQLNKKNADEKILFQSPLKKLQNINNDKIVKPENIFTDRKNSIGIDLTEEKNIEFFSNLQNIVNVKASSIVNGIDKISSISEKIISPYDKEKIIGQANYADESIINEALENLNLYNNEWKNSSLSKRIDIVNKFSKLLENNYHLLVSCCVKEAGKTISDSIADIREAIDFCRYYAVEAKKIFEEKNLPGPTGEKNTYKLKARGMTIVISPWNFPIAIFVGQMIASLICGNVTVVKPAEQTSNLSYVIFKLLLKAGLPKNAAALILGRGEIIGPQIFSHKDLQNVVFTGSLETAKIIQKTLYERDDLINLIAETGGLNCLIADSSALTEHIVEDVINSAFNSAGQRCSACRILCIEENVYKKTLSMLKGAVDALSVSNPEFISTDIGPVIDEEAKEKINHHIKSFAYKYQSNCINKKEGFFVNPTILEINNIDEVKNEIFGPVLHVLSFNSKNIIDLCKQINSLNYGLTLGIHSRIDRVINTVIKNTNVGNTYINRNIVGAVVGSQPFGGHNRSGTGPKAGGPEYLKKFCHEYSISNNLVAMGGNVDLLSKVYD